MDKYLNKPKSRMLHDHIIELLSQEHSIPKKDIRLIVGEMFSNAKKALKENGSVELSGFGRFYFNKKRAKHTFINFRKVVAKEKEEHQTKELTLEEVNYYEQRHEDMLRKATIIEDKYKLHKDDTKAPY